MKWKKSTRGLFVLGLLLLSALAVSTVLALTGYETAWWTADVGGGTSTGGTFALSGTIGQAGAGPRLANGDYALIGGFWPGASPGYVTYAPILMRDYLP